MDIIFLEKVENGEKEKFNFLFLFDDKIYNLIYHPYNLINSLHEVIFKINSF